MQNSREKFIEEIANIPNKVKNTILISGDKYIIIRYDKELVERGLSAFPELEKKNKLFHFTYTLTSNGFYYNLDPYEEDIVIPVKVRIDDDETNNKYLVLEFN